MAGLLRWSGTRSVSGGVEIRQDIRGVFPKLGYFYVMDAEQVRTRRPVWYSF